MINNDVIFYFLDLLEVVGSTFNIKKDYDNIYHNYFSCLYKLVRNEEENIEIKKDVRELIEKFILNSKVEKHKNIIFSLLNPNEVFSDADEDYINSLNLSMLNDRQLLKYYVLIVGTINMVQKGNHLLLKYSKTIFNTGWHKLAELCRGKVIYLPSYKIEAYPFDKFFNLNETPEVTEDKIVDYIKKAKIITVTDKMDGSLISVTKIRTGYYIINTNGDFDNIQTELAIKLLKEKYPYFFENMPTNKTYIFELIHPEDKHIVDYGKKEMLCLLGMRDLTSFKLAEYSELKEFAKEYSLDIVEQIEFTTLKDFTTKVSGEYENKEGFVFRLIGEDFDVMFKLKYAEYFNLHRMATGISMKKVYNQLSNFETLIKNMEGALLEGILSTVEEISIVKEKANKYVCDRAETLLAENNLTLETFYDDYDKMVKFIHNTFKTERYGYEIIEYIKKPHRREILFENTKTKRFFDVVYPDFSS